MNLLKETIEILEENKKTFEDIEWIGTKNHFIDVERFKKIADTEYDDGYGSPQVAQNLIIVGNNWWLERHEYDGSEWWEYKEIYKKPSNELDLKALTIEQSNELGFDVSCGWESLTRINGCSKNNE